MMDQATTEALLPRLLAVRDDKHEIDRKEKRVAGQVKQYLELNDIYELVDGESGVRAFLESRSTTEWDTRSMPDELILWARDQGYLQVTTALVDAARKAAPAIQLDDIQRFRIRGETFALKVEKHV